MIGNGVMALPVGAAGTTTLHFFSTQGTLVVNSATGQPLTNPNVPLTAGDHYDSTDLYYVGSNLRHAPTFSGSDHLACVVATASSVAERQTCSDQFAIGSALLLATNVTVKFNGRTALTPINGGTGRYKNARGTLVSKPIANSSNTDNTFTLTGVAAGPVAVSASGNGTTLQFYSVQQTVTGINRAGQPVKNVDDPNNLASYDTTDLYYAGTHQHHASSFSASDHIACTFTAADTQTCNTQVAIGGSLLLSNNATETGADSTTVSAPIDAGTGKYENTRGTFVSTVGNNDDVTITLTG